MMVLLTSLVVVLVVMERTDSAQPRAGRVVLSAQTRDRLNIQSAESNHPRSSGRVLSSVRTRDRLNIDSALPRSSGRMPPSVQIRDRLNNSQSFSNLKQSVVVSHFRTIRRADERLEMRHNEGRSAVDIVTSQDVVVGVGLSKMESIALFLAGFLCISGVVLSMCSFCDACRGKKQKDKEAYQNGYIGHIDLANIKVIYNPAAVADFHIPVYMHEAGGVNTGGVRVKQGGLNNKGFTESQESLVLGNAAALTSAHVQGTRPTTTNPGTYDTRKQNAPAVIHTAHSQNSTVPRTSRGSPNTASHADGTVTYSRNESGRLTTYDIATASARVGTTLPPSTSIGKLKDIQVDRGNRIVLTYENGSALADTCGRRTDLSNAGQISSNGAETRTGTGRGNAKRKASRDIEEVANKGTGLSYDMNDVAIKNMYARY